MLNKLFSERLNKELDHMGLPEILKDRIEALSEFIKISKFKADGLVRGTINPDTATLEKLAHELEVTPEWLLGKSDSKK